MSQGNFSVYPAKSLLSFLDICFLSIWQVLNNYFIKYYFCAFLLFSPPGTSIIHMVVCWWHLTALVIFFTLFSFWVFKVDNLNWCIFKFTDSLSACSNVLLKPASGFFLSAITFSAPELQLGPFCNCYPFLMPLFGGRASSWLSSVCWPQLL